MRYFGSKPAESFDFKDILYAKNDWIAKVTINRPDSYNCYTTFTLDELIQAFHDAAYDDKVAVIVYTAAGDKAFCTGGDVKEYEEDYTKRPRDYWKYMCLFRAYIESIINAGKPVVARINGMAVGGGNESQLACDLAVMSDHTFLAQVGTNVGSVACGGSTQWLPIHVGDRRAREILMLNDRIPAAKALEWGLVNYVVPFTELDNKVNEVCDKLKNKFIECTRYTKQQVNFWKELGWHNTIGHARDWLSIHYTSWEPLEGMGAFVEKRKANYLGLRELAAEGKSSEFMYGPYTQTCPSCNAKGIPEEFKFCGVCGTRLKE